MNYFTVHQIYILFTTIEEIPTLQSPSLLVTYYTTQETQRHTLYTLCLGVGYRLTKPQFSRLQCGGWWNHHILAPTTHFLQP